MKKLKELKELLTFVSEKSFELNWKTLVICSNEGVPVGVIAGIPSMMEDLKVLVDDSSSMNKDDAKLIEKKAKETVDLILDSIEFPVADDLPSIILPEDDENYH